MDQVNRGWCFQSNLLAKQFYKVIKECLPIPLTKALKELFDSIKKTLGIYQSPETGRPYSKNITRIFNRSSKKAGIEISLNEWIRKFFAMQALQSIEKGMVSHLLRHQDPRMIDHYAEYQTGPLKSALNKVQSIGKKRLKMKSP